MFWNIRQIGKRINSILKRWVPHSGTYASISSGQSWHEGTINFTSGTFEPIHIRKYNARWYQADGGESLTCTVQGKMEDGTWITFKTSSGGASTGWKGVSGTYSGNETFVQWRYRITGHSNYYVQGYLMEWETFE